MILNLLNIGSADNKLVGKRLKVARKLAGLSQTELAEKTGLSRGSISRYETGERRMYVETSQKIANALKVDEMKFATYLLAGREDSACDPEKPENVKVFLWETQEETTRVLVDSLFSEMDEKMLLNKLFSKLNDKGQKEAAKRIEEMTHIEKYTIPDNNEED